MAYAQCPKCHARLRVPDSRQSLHVRCPGCREDFQTRPGARQEAAPTSVAAGRRRPLVKWALAAWAILAIGAAGGVTYLLVTDAGPTKASVPDEPTLPVTTTGNGATPLPGAGGTGGKPDIRNDIIPPPPVDGIDETQYDKKDKKPPRKPRKKKGRGNRRSKTSKSGDGELKKTDLSASRG